MIPLRDENPSSRRAWMTVVLVVANLAAFAYELTLDTAQLGALINQLGFVPAAALKQPLVLGRLSSALTSMFLHAGWVHLLGNMLYLWVFGRSVEAGLGSWRYVGLYFASGIAAVAAQVAANPESTLPLIGASGAIAGVLGTYVMLYPRRRIVVLIPIVFVFEIASVPAVFVIGLWFLLQVAQGLGTIAQSASAGGVAWFAHIGGFVAGLAFGAIARLTKTTRTRWTG